jgi:hypothetical protein
MSKELKNITDNIMDQIHKEKIKMRPKAYFILGSIITFMGLVFSIVTSVFLFGLIRFTLRAHGPMASYRFDKILSSFPLWAPALAIVGLVVGVWLLRKYDFSFKLNFKLIVAGFILAVIAGGWIIDIIGLNDALSRRGPMKGMMRQYIQDNDISGEKEYGPGRGKGLRQQI